MAIRIPIISDFDDKGIARATREFQKLETTGQKAQFAIQKAAMPAALALGGLAVAAGSAFNAFAEDAAAADKLALSLKNSTGATDDQVKAVEDFISQTSRAAAVADDELRPALDNLVRGTKDVTAAQDLLGLALDISAGTGKDLDGVTQALSKAYNGNFTALKKLDPALAALIKSGASTDEVFAALGKTFGGQAAAQANTAQGRMKNLSIQMGELKESIGAAVAPLIERLLPAFQSVGDWIANNTGVIVGLGIAIGGFALAIWGANAAMTAWNAITKITAALNAVLGTSFSALWVATGVGIIVAIIAAVVLLNEKFGFMDNVIEAIKTAFQKFWDTVSTIFGWIYDKIKVVADFLGSAFSVAFDLVKGYINIWWTIYSTTFGWVYDKIKLVADFLAKAFKFGIDLVVGYFKFWYDTAIGFIDLLKGGIEAVVDVIIGIGDTIVSAFKTAFNKVAEFWNNTVGKLKFTVPDWVPLIGGKTFAVPQIPMLADGGIVDGPTLAMIGERGPEAVIPLNRANMMGNITINVAGSVTSEADLIETIRKGLVNAQRNGAGLVYSNV